MAAGLGFKTFTTGEVLTAADTNGYLMQGVLVFASSVARAAAITSPQEGQYSYLKDTNSTEYYDGAAWIAAPIGDITGVTAGTGISGGGTSGTVTITNSMATEITAKGDLIAGTGSATFDNLAVGTNGQVLQADSTASTGLKWATASAGALTLISTQTLGASTATVTFSSIPSTYQHLQILWNAGTGGDFMKMNFNGITTSTYYDQYTTAYATVVAAAESRGATYMQLALPNSFGSGVAWIPNYKTTAFKKSFVGDSGYRYGTGTNEIRRMAFFGTNDATTAISQIDIGSVTGNFTTGSTFSLYGVS